MDILAHGLWTSAVYRASRKKPEDKKYNVWLATFFGVAPDLFSFGILSIQTFLGLGYGRPRFTAGGVPDHFYVPHYVDTLYNYTHSFIVFALVFGAIWFLLKKPFWELAAWGLHILIDIPSHSYGFFPTPFLWPLSNFKVNGISWGTPWFMAINYSILALVYFWLWRRSRRKWQGV